MASSVFEVPSEEREFVPIPVRREAAAIAERTGAAPLIEHESTTVIRVSHTRGRLRVEVTFRRGSRGWQHSGCRLLKDGKPKECTDLWAMYDELSKSLPATADGPARLPSLTPLDEDACPTELRPSFAFLRRRLRGRTDVAVSAGRDDTGRFVLVVASSEATVHMLFETEWRHGRQSVVPATNDPIRVVSADGKDLTEDANGKLKEALSRLLATPPGSGGGEADAGSTQGAQAGGPSSRKGTVQRE